MEGVSTIMYKRLRGYRQRRGYVKLNGGSRGGARRSRVELGGGSSSRRRFWKIRVKAKVRLPSPKKFFVWLRNAYVKMMLGLANSRAVTGYGGAMGDHGVSAFGKHPIKEYDEKMIFEIYKSLVMSQGQLMPREVGKLSSAVICQR
ncbi:glycosyl transferase family 8 family protein [Hibiscus syriacus]|uniref:Glycosyl transferase family 8 family protein n=2 Tax=Hibiscus syriacus TaxID=106335 RepID=A0A6A2X8K8_HIBSY|nr:glycosyl transferase family 8 family protein [Hibiscus syriacus]